MTAFLRRAARRAASFARRESGATMVEFGLLAAPFLYLMAGILEVAMVFWTSQVLETAVQNAARQIYTGQFQTDPANANQTTTVLSQRFKTLLCANVTALIDCNSAVAIDVRSVSSFSSASVPTNISSGAYNTSGYGYQTLAAGQIALVTASLNSSSMTRLFGGTPGLSDGSRIIMATAVFQVEPYQ